MPINCGKKVVVNTDGNGSITSINGKTGTVTLTKEDIGLSNIDNTPKISTEEKGSANGVAMLDINGKVVYNQLPESILGSVNYRGVWNANTNSPSIPTAISGNKGWYYVVQVAGSTNINGVSSWAVGDWIISDGSSWSKITTTQSVSSVSGKTGAVTLTKSDVGLNNVQNVDQTNANNLTSGTVDIARLPAMGASGTNHKAGLVPDTPTTVGNTKYLCEDGTWNIPEGSGGSSGDSLTMQFPYAEDINAGTVVELINDTGTAKVQKITRLNSTPTTLLSSGTQGSIASHIDYKNNGIIPMGGNYMLCKCIINQLHMRFM